MIQLLLYLFLALSVSFLCSLLEASLLSTTLTFINVKESEGSKAAIRMKQFKTEPDRPLAAILSLNTIANTIGAAGVGQQATEVFGSAWFGLVSAIMTLLILIFSEIVPKTLGTTYWKNIMGFVSMAIWCLIRVMYPIVLLIEFVTRILPHNEEAAVSREEVVALANVGEEEGVIEEDENKIIRNVMRLDDVKAYDVMTPSVVAATASEQMTLKEYYEDMRYDHFSRIPVYAEKPEFITGYILRGDALENLTEDKFGMTLGEIKRPLPMFNEEATIGDIFDQMLKQKSQIGVVIDDYGCFRGIVTLEDVIETIFGLEIIDENDEIADDYIIAKFEEVKRVKNLRNDFNAIGFAGKEKDDEGSEPIDMAECLQIDQREEGDKYIITLDVGGRTYEFFSDVLGERDKWFEVLKNSRRTAKEYQLSVLKNPRNTDLMAAYFAKGEETLNDKLKDEIKTIVGDTKEIKEYVILEFSIKSLKENILNSIDGINSTLPRNVELLTSYGDYMNTEFLDIIKNYWESQFSSLENADIMKLGMMLFEYQGQLDKVQVTDDNIKRNGKEFVKIFMKKTFKNILDVIESILKNERENKAFRNNNGAYCTSGPADLFDILSKTYELVQNYPHPIVYDQMFNLFNECIIQYLIGVDCVTSNFKIQVDKEFLLAIANNAFDLSQRLSTLIEDCCKTNVMTEKEAYEAIRFKQIGASINLMTSNSVSRFVSLFTDELSAVFKENNFLEMDIGNVMVKTRDIFCSYNEYMDKSIMKKVWEEILKMSVFFYVRCLLQTGSKGLKDVSELNNKIENDEGALRETYAGIVGNNLTEQNLKILKDLRDFLTISSYMISSSCLTIREYIGPSFKLKTAKTLVSMRTDFTKQDREDAIDQCKEVLEKYEGSSKPGSGGFFERMKSEIAKEDEELEPEEEKKEEPADQSEVFALDDFLNNEDDDEELVQAEEQPKEEIKVEQEEVEVVTDVKKEGTMEKKSHDKWQKRYFQLKGGYLYWYKDKTSKLYQNKLSIEKTLKVEAEKEKKFMVIVNDDKDKDGEEGDLGKIYRFKCKSDEEKMEWINAITAEMKAFHGVKKIQQSKIPMKLKKKVIRDLFELPEVGKDRSYMKTRTQQLMKGESYFKASVKKEKKKDDMAYVSEHNDASASNEELIPAEKASFEVQDVKEVGGEESFCDKCNKCLNGLLGSGDNAGNEKLNQ